MSHDNDDDITPVERPLPRTISLDKLEMYAARLTERGELKAANDALVLQQLISSLRANAERDLLMAQMSARFEELEHQFHEERALHSAAYQALVEEFKKLQRQQDELRARQDTIAATIDAGIEEISKIIRKLDNVSASVADLNEP